MTEITARLSTGLALLGAEPFEQKRIMRTGVTPLLLCLLVAHLASAGEAGAQVVTCRLEPGTSNSFAGQCQARSSAVSVVLHRPTSESDAIWVGTLSDEVGSSVIEVTSYQYAAGPRLVVRTDTWHLVTYFSHSDDGLTLAWDDEVEAPPSQTDLQILQEAGALLSDEGIWDREDDRNCENDTSLLSLYCALARATREAMGAYQHRQPAMQAVRRTIRSEWPDRVISHRLMDFNNDPQTTLADVRRLLRLAEESLRQAVR